MTIIFDFDWTLFDTDRLIRSLSFAAERLGVSKELYDEVRITAEQELPYNFEEHCKLIADESGCDVELLRRLWGHAVSHASMYLYDDVGLGLDALKHEEYRLLLLTFGVEEYQKMKVISSGIDKQFDDVLYTEENDGKHRKLPFSSEDIFVFINDNPDENKSVQKEYPNAEVLQMVRPGGRYSAEIGQRVVHSMEELFSVLKHPNY